MKKLIALLLIAIPVLSVCTAEVTEDENEAHEQGIETMEEIEVKDEEILNFDENVYFQDHNSDYIEIEGADIETHEFLDDFFSKDASNAYCGYTLIEGVDVENFAILTKGYATDSETVYYRGPTPLVEDGCFVADLDPETFVVFEEGFVGDAGQVFHPLVFTNEKFSIDPATFEIIGEGWYVKDTYGVYFLSWQDDRFQITEADLASFEVMDLVEEASGGIYAQDNNFCYLFGKVTECPVTD